MTKERGIIFSGEMVRAILDGHKTVTRRVLKQELRLKSGPVFDEWTMPGAVGYQRFFTIDTLGREWDSFTCPYGYAGDRLYVRETMWTNGGYVATDKAQYKNEGKRPAIFMRKTDARIWLDVTGVRVERVQDMTDVDARREGFHSTGEFRFLWDQLNTKRGYPWSANDWVWVIEFQRVDK